MRFLGLLFLLLLPVKSWALSAEYQEIVERNLFSQNRKYEPFQGEEKRTNPFKEDEIKKNIFLRGIYRKEKDIWVILEIKPHLLKKWGIEKQKRFFRVGEKVGPYQIVNTEKGKVVLKGEEQEIILSFKDLPERKKPVPKRILKPPSSLATLKASSKKAQKTKPFKKTENPFKAFLKKTQNK